MQRVLTMISSPAYKGAETVSREHGGERFVFVDVLNVIACFAVVMLHVSLIVFSPQATENWIFAVLIQALNIFAVPVFFMISGMNLLAYRRRYSTRTFFRKRFWRVGRALLIGSLFCYLVFCMFPQSFYGAELFKFGPADFLRRFLTNSINDTYWFFYDIIYLYILTPILSSLIQRKRLMEYTIILTLAISIGIPLCERLGIGHQYFDQLFSWPLFASVPLLYFLLGYYIKSNYHPKRWHCWVALAVFLISSGMMFYLGLWSNGYHKPSGLASYYDPYYIGISSPFCLVQSVSVFVFFRSIEPSLRGLRADIKSFLRVLSSASLGVYLFHILLVDWLGVHNLPHIFDPLVDHMLSRGICIYILTAFVVAMGKSFFTKLKSCLSLRVPTLMPRFSDRS